MLSRESGSSERAAVSAIIETGPVIEIKDGRMTEEVLDGQKLRGRNLDKV
jgi:hypothetical protein